MDLPGAGPEESLAKKRKPLLAASLDQLTKMKVAAEAESMAEGDSMSVASTAGPETWSELDLGEQDPKDGPHHPTSNILSAIPEQAE